MGDTNFLTFKVLASGREGNDTSQEGGGAVAVYEAMALMITFGGFIVSLIGLVIVIVRLIRK